MNVALVAVALCVSACVVPELDNEQTTEVQQSVWTNENCDDWGCGMNSPYIEQYGFHFLYKPVPGQPPRPNPQGFAIAAFTKYIDGAYRALAFKVLNGRITGTRSDGTVLGEQNLVGAKLYITHNGVYQYMIRIKGYETTQSWAVNADGQRFRVRTYLLEWANIARPDFFYNICTNPGADDTLGMNEHHTLVFEGDVINAQLKQVSSQLDNTVVNFGCAGGTLAKMHLTGHTQVAANFGWVTTPSERQTMLKMLTADYCGNGTPHTVGGQPLGWTDHRYWMTAPTTATPEATWAQWGATCLNTPRLAWTDPEGNVDLRDDINDECAQPLEPCPTNPTLGPLPGNHLLSANPTL
jgi:hypothetical protein